MINVGQMIGVVPAMLFMDDIGRRPLAIGGAIAMGIPHTLMAAMTGKYGDDWPAHPGVGWFCVALICMSPNPPHLLFLTDPCTKIST